MSSWVQLALFMGTIAGLLLLSLNPFLGIIITGSCSLGLMWDEDRQETVSRDNHKEKLQ